MGYQESYIKAKNNNLESVLDIFKKYNIRCENDFFASCVAKITIQKNLYSVEHNKFLAKGEEYLYISGDRSVQRDNICLFDIESKEDYESFSVEEREIIDNIDIIYTEYIPSSVIFDKDNGYAIIEDLKLSPINVDNKLN